MELNIKPLVSFPLDKPELTFSKISNLTEFKSSECIFVKTLNPDYTLLLDKIKLIVSESGSQLSHLAIVAREMKVPVFLLDSGMEGLPERGIVLVDGKKLVIKNG